MSDNLIIESIGELALPVRDELFATLGRLGVNYKWSVDEDSQTTETDVREPIPRPSFSGHDMQEYETEMGLPSGSSYKAWRAIVRAYVRGSMEGLEFKKVPSLTDKSTTESANTITSIDLLSLSDIFFPKLHAAQNDQRYGYKNNFGLNFGKANIEFIYGFLLSNKVQEIITGYREATQ